MHIDHAKSGHIDKLLSNDTIEIGRNDQIRLKGLDLLNHRFTVGIRRMYSWNAKSLTELAHRIHFFASLKHNVEYVGQKQKNIKIDEMAAQIMYKGEPGSPPIQNKLFPKRSVRSSITIGGNNAHNAFAKCFNKFMNSDCRIERVKRANHNTIDTSKLFVRILFFYPLLHNLIASCLIGLIPESKNPFTISASGIFDFEQ